MKIQLSDHFNYRRLLRFTAPSIFMMIFTSIYSIVDGFFVSNLVGKTAFAAVNFAMPILMVLGAIGFMFGAGGSALIAKTMGEGNHKKAKELFSLLVLCGAVCGILLGVVGFFTIRPLCAMLGAEGQLLEDSVRYSRTILLAMPFYLLQVEFQSFFIAAEKPQLGMWMTIISGVLNMLLDWLLVGVCSMGLVGAGLATGISQTVGGVLALLYFLFPNKGLLRLCRPKRDRRALLKVCTNGASELMSNVAMSALGVLYNIQLLRYAGEDGVAAYGVVMYVMMIFLSVYIGYGTGIAPVVSYHFGAKNHTELKNLFRRSVRIILACSLLMFGSGLLFAEPLSRIFVGYDAVLLSMTVRAMQVYSVSFLLSGVAILGSCFFTALNDGVTSAIISFMRTLVFQSAAVMLMPLIWGVDGIWWSVVGSEAMAMATAVFFFYRHRHKFHYA